MSCTAGSARVSGTTFGICPLSMRTQYVSSSGIDPPDWSSLALLSPTTARIVCACSSNVPT